jgi:LAO/AO transport system kinase
VSIAALVERVRSGDTRAIARAISLIEDEHPAAPALLADLHRATGHAWLVGVTGPPGAGKSTLVDRLVVHLRATGQRVGVLAVDPSSPYTGGALLGDRVRMQRHALDRDVFIRSMATRGHLGGLARTTSDAAVVLDAAAFDVVLIETVGVGQDEVDVVRTADVSVVVVVPGTGDDVQALKAGIMEIADVFVVNKADHEGADRAVASIEAMLTLHAARPGTWRPPVVRTEATTGAGIEALWAQVEACRQHLAGAQDQRRRMRAAFRLREVLASRFLRHVEEAVLTGEAFDVLVDAVATRTADPYTAADQVLHDALRARAADAAAVPGARDGATPAIDHVAVAVQDVEAAVAFFTGHLGLEVGPPETVASQGVRVRFLASAAGRIELLEPLGPETPVGRFLDKRGPGLHHVALAVDGLAALLRTLDARGVRLIDTVPRPGAGGSLIAFVHPSATGGVLVELKERK